MAAGCSTHDRRGRDEKDDPVQSFHPPEICGGTGRAIGGMTLRQRLEDEEHDRENRP